MIPKQLFRSLVANKVTTVLNIAGLMIGVAVCLLIGIWLQRELSFDNFHPNGDSIFRIANTFRSESETFSQAPSGVALGLLPREVPAVKSACRILAIEYKFKAGEKQFIESKTLLVDSNFFEFFGFRLIEGLPERVLHASDEVVLSENAAIKYFGTAHHIAGRTILLNGQPMTVAGVSANPPVNSQIQFDILVPYTFFRDRFKQRWKEDLDEDWVGGWPHVFVQLTDPAKWKQAESQINDVVARHSAKDWAANKMSYRYFLQPLRDIHLRSHLRYDAANNGSQATVEIFGIVGVIVLLLACINYINLTTAGAIRRAKETSVRKVVGATRLQLIRQYCAETFLICLIAVMLGVALVRLILPAFSAWMGQPYSLPVTMGTIALGFGFVVLVAATAGIYPALMLSSFNPALSLKGVFLRNPKGNFVRKGLIVFQFTITIVLIISILVIIRQMSYIRNKSLGFEGSAVVEVNFSGEQQVRQRYSAIRDQLLKNPDVLNVAFHDANVVGGLGNSWTTTVNEKGQEVSSSIYQLQVDADYLDVYGMKLAAGRFFSKDIPTDTVRSVLVNQAAVRNFGWKSPEDALGKPFGKGAETKYVIGVVRDFNFESLHKSVEPLLIGYIAGYNGNLFSLKIDGRHIDAALDQLKKTWKLLEPQVPLSYSFVDERIAEQYGNEQKMEGIFYGFAGLSLLIACLGLFGLTMYMIERKVKEIGIRKVLGAGIPGIVGLLSRDFLRQVGLAAVIAFPLAWWAMDRWLQAFAYRTPIEWWIFAVAGISAALLALLTISFQTVRAALANPAKSLRTE